MPYYARTQTYSINVMLHKTTHEMAMPVFFHIQDKMVKIPIYKTASLLPKAAGVLKGLEIFYASQLKNKFHGVQWDFL